MKNKYSVGANFERRVIKDLEAKGWWCFRSAGSHGVADVIAFKAGECMWIQCQTDKYFPPVKVQVLVEGARLNNVQAWLCWRGDKRKICMEQVY